MPWWIAPLIITLFFADVIWLVIMEVFLKDYECTHNWPIYILAGLCASWIILMVIAFLVEVIIPIFLAFWLAFKS